MGKSSAHNNGYQVAAVRKALKILSSFTPATPSLTVTDASRRLKIPKSTAHNLLRTLQSLEFITQDPKDKCYRLGPRIFELGLLFCPTMQLVTEALPHLRRLAEQTKETVKLGALTDAEVLVLTAIESPHTLHTRGDEGRRAPLHCTGLGKALLASVSDEEIRGSIAQRGLIPFTGRTITTLARLEQEVEQIRASGYAVDWEEHEPGVRCIGAAINAPQGRARAAICVSGPVSRITDEKIVELAPLVVRAAGAVSAAWGDRRQGSHLL